MLNILTTLTQTFFCKKNTKLPIKIDTLKELRYESRNIKEPNDYFRPNKPGGILLKYYNDTEQEVGYIRYYITTGQIGLFFIDKKYQNCGIGKQILSKVMEELKDNDCEECWAVTTMDHPFWSNVFDKSFKYKYPVHKTVTGQGYVIKLK
jgi:GNAT superfamily N-acetyltransferase